VQVYLWHADSLEDGKEFLVAGDKDKLQPKAEEEKKEEAPKEDTNGSSKDQAIDVDDDIIEVANGSSNGSGDKKRPHDEENGNGTDAKKARIEDRTEVEIMSERSAEEVTADQLKKRKLQEEEEDVVCIE